MKFTDPVSGEVYFLELRLPVSYDTAEAVNLNSGVKIVQQLGAGSLILLPDSRPFAGYYNPRQTWQAGQTFTTHAGTRVRIDAITSTSASVTVESHTLDSRQSDRPCRCSHARAGKPDCPPWPAGLGPADATRSFQRGAVHWTPAPARWPRPARSAPPGGL